MILYVFYILLTSLFGSSIIGGVILILFSWLVGTATNLKIFHRSEPIYPSDVYWLEEWPFLIQMIGWQTALIMVAVIAMSIYLLVRLYKKYIKPPKDTKLSKQSIIYRVIGVFISIGLFFYISKFNYADNQVKDIYDNHANWVGWSQMSNYNTNGFIAGFLYNLDAQPMEPPEDYSRERIEDIFNKYKDKAVEINQNKGVKDTDTNILFVMNESFSDPSNLEGLGTNKDPLPYYREIIEESISGSLLVPGYGGGTANNEFQVLTGISMEPLSPMITSPFVQLSNNMADFPSVADKMKKEGYRSTAIHSYSPSFYRRRDVYEYLNFDEFIHEETMKYTDSVNENHPYVSDESIYREMFDVMENTEERDFLHLVTMQNHSGYRNKYENIDYEVSGSGDYGSANGYFQDLENSDLALNQLITQIDGYDEPILLLFWGDHLPGLYEGEITKKNSATTLRETPFFIYSNEKELNEDIGLRSLIFLNNYIVQSLNLDVAPFGAMLLELEDHLPVVDDRMYYDENKDEALYSREELSAESLNILEEYSVLLYDITTGNNYAQDIGFFEYFDE